jgi:hypothetical protein
LQLRGLLGNPVLPLVFLLPALADLLCNVLHYIYQVIHVLVPLGPQVLVEYGVYLPTV